MKKDASRDVFCPVARSGTSVPPRLGPDPTPTPRTLDGEALQIGQRLHHNSEDLPNAPRSVREVAIPPRVRSQTHHLVVDLEQLLDLLLRPIACVALASAQDRRVGASRAAHR